MWNDAINDYKKNIWAAVLFGFLLAFVIPLLFFSSTFISSGSVFVNYDTVLQSSLFEAIAQIAIFVVFITLYAFLVAFLAFMVKTQIGHQHHFKESMKEKLAVNASKIAIYYLIFMAISFVVMLLINTYIPEYQYIGTIIIALIWLITMFVPQAIVLDERHLQEALESNFAFLKNNFGTALEIIAVAIVLTAILIGLETTFDSILFLGRYGSLIVMFVVIIPFIEIVKTRAFIRKYRLLY